MIVDILLQKSNHHNIKECHNRWQEVSKTFKKCHHLQIINKNLNWFQIMILAYWLIQDK